MTAVIQTAAILADDPNRLVSKHEAMELLGITRNPVWRDFVRRGEVAIFQPAAGPKPPYVLMQTLQDYVLRQQARAERDRHRRSNAAQRKAG